MSKIVIKILGFSVLAVLLVGIWFYVSTNDPVKIGNKLTGLNLPSDSKTLVFKRSSDEFNGDGYVLIVLKISDNEIASLAKACESRKYRNLSDDFIPPNETIKDLYSIKEQGVYKEVKNSNKYINVILLKDFC